MINPKNVHTTIDKYMLADGMKPVVDLEKSHGSWLVDSRDGKEYLDLFSMFASMSVGYNHPYILEHEDLITKAALNKPTNSDIYSTQMAEFVETMGRIAQPEYLPHSFYIEGGGLAIENALKTAFDWKVRKNVENGHGEKGSKIIHFKDCFHGRTGYTMSLTDSPDPRKTLYFPQFDWPRITNPKITFPLSENLEFVLESEKKAVHEIKEAFQQNKNDIAAIIIEPIQGEGGDNHFRPEFFKKLKTLSLENETLLIYDEVQTGIGITGKMWAHQCPCKTDCHSCNGHCEEREPDIIGFGKKTQVCGIFAGKRIDEVEKNVFNESSRLNSTWGGNVVDMVRISLYLQIIENENLVEKAGKSGNYLVTKLNEIQQKYPELVSNARGQGLFAAFDLPNGDSRDKLAELIMEEGAIILGSGVRSIRFRPHLNITNEEIDHGIEIIIRALHRM
jgi:L-lysine 6-transaminase|tara:strand:+ start:104 stop:1447 length:1344 start_codon:yes stop_codon:yes gene_type:complete